MAGIGPWRSACSEGVVGSWGFIALAYGVATIALFGYLTFLGRRLREVGEELAAMEREGERKRR